MSLKSWNTTQIFLLYFCTSVSLYLATSSFPWNTVLRGGLSCLIRNFTNVVFPTPEFHITKQKSFSCKVKLKSWNNGSWSLYPQVRCCISISGISIDTCNKVVEHRTTLFYTQQAKYTKIPHTSMWLLLTFSSKKSIKKVCLWENDLYRKQQ